MQLAYHLGFRTFLCAGFELAGEKFYSHGPFSERALEGQRCLFTMVRPTLDALGVRAFLVEPGPSCQNNAFPQISLEETNALHP